MTTETFTLEPENYRPKDIVKYRHLPPSGNRALLITTIQNIYISNETSQKKKNKKKKQLYKLKVLIFKLLNDSYLFKVLQKICYNIFSLFLELAFRACY